MLKDPLQSELKASQRRSERLEELFRALGHDIQAPLRAILSLADWVGQDLDPSKTEAHENLELLKARARRLERLILAVAEYAKLGQSQEALSEVDLRSLALGLFKELSQERQARLDLELRPERIQTAPLALRRVLEELLRNALMHHEAGEAHLSLSVKEAPEAFEIEVGDDGPGIDPRFHEEIFLPGRTLKSKDQLEANGMGLTLVAAIVEKRGGRIRVDSALGKGTRIRIHWPKN